MTTTPIECAHDCGRPAYAHVRWGKDPERQQANLCREHLQETWEACASQIRAGVCFWIQSPPHDSEEEVKP